MSVTTGRLADIGSADAETLVDNARGASQRLLRQLNRRVTERDAWGVRTSLAGALAFTALYAALTLTLGAFTGGVLTVLPLLVLPVVVCALMLGARAGLVSYLSVAAASLGAVLVVENGNPPAASWLALVSTNAAAIVALLLTEGMCRALVQVNAQAETTAQLHARAVAGEMRWRSFAEGVPAFVSEYAPDGRIIYVNQRYIDYTGRTLEELQRAPLECVHPDDARRLVEAWVDGVRSRTPIEIEWRARRRDGVYRWQYGVSVPVLDSSGVVTAWLSTVVDIDRRKRSEDKLGEQSQQLRESEARARLALRAAGMDAWHIDIEDGRLTTAHHDVGASWGDGEPAQTYQALLEHVHPDDAAGVRTAIQEALASGHALELECRTVGRDGALRWVHCWGQIIRAADGTPRRWIAVNQDVTARKRAEESLRDSDAHLQRLADANVMGVLSGDGRAIVAINDGLLKITGHARPDPSQPEQAMMRDGRGWLELVGVDEMMRRGAGHVKRAEYLRPDGVVVPVLVYGIVVERQPFRWTALVVDLTEEFTVERAVRESLREAEETRRRLAAENAAKDEFLALVSHELKTPITTIAGDAQVLEERGLLIGDRDRARALSDIREEAQRLARIIDGMLTLAHLDNGGVAAAEVVALPALVQEVVGRHQRAFRQRQIRLDVAADVPRALATPVFVDQALANLLANAEKYSPSDSVVDVAVSKEDDAVAVRVLDRGPGLSAEEMCRVFDRFYRAASTSEYAGGHGIGLAVCKRLIEAQGGAVWARPRDGGGSEFGFSLPVAQPDHDADVLLLRRIGDGDVDALNELYERYRGFVFRSVQRWLPDRDAADEVAQDVFASVWRRAATYDPRQASVRTWLQSIARNRAYDRLRRARALPGILPGGQTDGAPPRPDRAYADIAHEELQERLAKLPEEQRIAVEAVYFGGCTFADLAEMMDVPLGTAKSRVRLGLRKLRSLL